MVLLRVVTNRVIFLYHVIRVWKSTSAMEGGVGRYGTSYVRAAILKKVELYLRIHHIIVWGRCCLRPFESLWVLFFIWASVCCNNTLVLYDLDLCLQSGLRNIANFLFGFLLEQFWFCSRSRESSVEAFFVALSVYKKWIFQQLFNSYA